MKRPRDRVVVRAADLPDERPQGRVRLAAVQMEPKLGQVKRNVAACVDAAEEAKTLGADLVAFPECMLTGYAYRSREEAWEAALDPEGELFAPLRRAARDLDLFLTVGYLERAGDELANAVSIVGPDGIVAHYRKTHLPHLGADRFTVPGRSLGEVRDVAGLRVGLQICWDASFPEVTRLQALEGADLVILPTNWPQEADIKADWLPNARAYENVIYFAAVNRLGTERGYVFHGRSRVCGPAGETLVEGPADREAILVADLDPARARTKKIQHREGEYWVDRIGQRREDLYLLRALKPEEGPR